MRVADRRLRRGLCPAVSGQSHHPGGSLCRRRAHRHRRPAAQPFDERDGGAAGHRREHAQRRRHDRRPPGRAAGGPTWNQQATVENTLGPGGTIAANRVAHAAPDGYTLFIHHIGHSTAPALYRKLPYDPINDFEPIGLVNEVPMTLLGKRDLPPKDLKELIAYLKANKDKVTLANAGLGSASHLCGMLFQTAVQIDLTTVPYEGTGPAMNDLLGGQVDV